MSCARFWLVRGLRRWRLRSTGEGSNGLFGAAAEEKGRGGG